ncbi:hypothetical protein KGR20_22340 [Cytobacillus oceanisediminis]|uniref:hypothetical protein n=1 Tax=Cytobacillus oceanisediminis TaxID=665099 RepID=UPI001CCB2A19|nr:hypothetical protein [Cytobacillus oceanisediminis]MBZ9536901.1 hypothetical protein [Cytobacillus oceanisediminis]
MKKLLLLCLTLVLSVVMAACGSDATDIKQSDDEKAKAKTDQTELADKENSEEADSKEKEEDIWTYYDDAKWEDSWEGLKFTIQKAVVSDKAPGLDDSGNEITTSAVGVKMQIENTTSDKIYTTYPDQATLVTSTGEQVDADMFISDHLGGEIHEGVIKEGNIIFYLERGNAESIEWIKLTWSNSYEDPDGDYEKDLYKDTEVKLELKK